MADPEADHGLVMPFVCCETHGGTYHDRSFVAGFSAGQLWADLAAGRHPMPCWSPPELVAQLDLIAMHYGYTMVCLPLLDDTESAPEWVHVSFTKDSAAV